MTAEVFGPYRLVSLLGAGGMGEVWRAVDTNHDDRVIALKVLLARFSDDPAFAGRFRRESRLVAGLTCPHIIPIHHYDKIDGRLFIDMPLIDGTDLGALIQHDGPLPPARAVRIIEQIADALDVAHEAGLVHRDVKPSNVLVTTRRGRDFVYLIDFGIARAADDTKITKTGAPLGTLAYMSPEQIHGGGDRRSDVYALACVLHAILTGRQPFKPPAFAHEMAFYINAHLHQSPPRASADVPAVSTALDDVIIRGMAKQPGDRYPSAGDLATAAHAALSPGRTYAAPRSADTDPLSPTIPTGKSTATGAPSGSGATPIDRPLVAGPSMEAPCAGPWPPPLPSRPSPQPVSQTTEPRIAIHPPAAEERRPTSTEGPHSLRLYGGGYELQHQLSREQQRAHEIQEKRTREQQRRRERAREIQKERTRIQLAPPPDPQAIDRRVRLIAPSGVGLVSGLEVLTLTNAGAVAACICAIGFASILYMSLRYVTVSFFHSKPPLWGFPGVFFISLSGYILIASLVVGAVHLPSGLEWLEWLIGLFVSLLLSYFIGCPMAIHETLLLRIYPSRIVAVSVLLVATCGAITFFWMPAYAIPGNMVGVFLATWTVAIAVGGVMFTFPSLRIPTSAGI